MSVDPTAAAPAVAAVPSPSPSWDRPFAFHMADLNPLQYVPVVGTIYRAVTGEELDPSWRVGGAVVTGALLGGPVGILTSLIGVGLEELFHCVVGEAKLEAQAPDAATRRQAIAAYSTTGNLGGGSG